MFTVITGFGYYVLNGVIIAKVQLPAGQHPNPSNGASYVEVADQATLDAVVVPLTPDQVAAQTQASLLAQIQANREAYIDALISGDTDTQSSIQTTQAALLSQAVAANVPLPATTVAQVSSASKSGLSVGTAASTAQKV
jgi:hypothetical protein